MKVLTRGQDCRSARFTEEHHIVARRFAANLRYVRARMALTQLDVGRLAGIPRATIAHFESGNGNPTLANLTALASALHTGVDALLSHDFSARPTSSELEREAIGATVGSKP